MRVAMYYRNSDVRLEEADEPRIGPGELLVKIWASGICGSDVMEWYRIHKAPLILGHEIAGEVVDVGDGVNSFKVGDRVTATHHVPCFTCHYCRTGHETVCDTLLSGTHFDPGGFCELTRLPAINVERGTWKLPEGMSYEEGTFVEPLACALRGQRRADVRPSSSALVLGSGIAGILHINLARALGAGLIVATDINDYRLEQAKKFGADEAVNAGENVAERFRSLNNGRGADFVIVCVAAASALEQAFDSVGRGGVILLFAPMMDGGESSLSLHKLFWRRDVTITSTYAGGPTDCADALELIHRKRVNVADMITHRFGLADAGRGFELVAAGGKSIKVIINPQE